MNIQDVNGPSVVLLVRNEKEAVNYYTDLGFKFESVGGHAHVSLGKVTLILHQAQNPDEIKPFSSASGGLYFDVFCYTSQLKELHELFITKGVPVVNGPFWGEGWSEFTIKDLNGYCIAFGGK
ncbi:bleomycin resistance protein [Paenibacillus tarimensis]